MVRRRDAGFQLATFWTALSLISSISVMVSPPGMPGGTVTVQGAFLAPLVVLSCWQLMVWAIFANRAAGVRGSRADSPPPVAHSPSPIYVPVFLLLVGSRLFCPCLCLNCHCSLPVPLSPCAAELKARRSSSSCGPQTLPVGSGISAA